jgi:tRNA threonylcarbamoyladenosine modification (KEOPS) complex Cgi121 subunit
VGVESAVVLPEPEPVAFLCSSDSSINSLVNNARKASSGNNFILLLDNRHEVPERLLPAYLNAYIRGMEKRKRSGSLQIELLLFIAGTFKINKAISDYGAKRNRDFILVGNNEESSRKYARQNNVRIRKRLRLRFGAEYLPVIE